MANFMKGLLKILKVIIKMLWKLGIIGWDDVLAFAEEYSLDSII